MTTTPQSPTLWEKIPVQARGRLIWWLWFATWLGLLVGYYDRIFYEYVVAFSAVQAALFLILFAFHIRPFPVQVRIAYLVWVAVGTYVPNMTFLMYITTAGLATNVFLGYCPLARMMFLMPWNLDEKFSLGLLRRVVFSRPVAGKFAPTL